MTRISALLLVVVLAPAAFAQESAADAGVASPAVAPPVAVAPAPPPAPPPAPWWEMLRLYGLVKATVNVSGSGVESYSQPNASAMTGAANPVLVNSGDKGRLSFQVAQSRAGLWFNEKGAYRAHLEFDFIDFSKATPTVASLPRLRIATVEWAPSPLFSLSVGQDWDLFSPLNPHGANLVGGSFLAGNTGFMRQQIIAHVKPAGWEFGASVGFPGINATAKDAAFELGLSPSFALRAARVFGVGKAGISGIAAPLVFGGGTPAERKGFAAGGNVFAEVTLFSGATNIRFEGYVGQNLSNMGLLSLSYGSTASDVQEWGGFLSARHKFTDMHFAYARAGIARVINRSAVVPSYRYAAIPTDGTLPAFSTAALGGTGPGIKANGTIVAGYELRVAKPLAFYLEGFFFRTEHTIATIDVDRASALSFAAGAELSAMVTF